MVLNQTRANERPLLRTKISVPRIMPEFVHRQRLTERIKRGVRGPVTLLAAPAGFGKTNLLIEWREETTLPVAWLNLDEEDNEISRFYSYLVGALQTLEPSLGEEGLDFIQSTRGSGLEVGLTLLINEISALPKEIALVLDDFQAIEDETLLQSIGFFIKHLPNNLHLLIASRNEPELDLVSLRAKGQMVELGVDDLRFTDKEIAQYFQQVIGIQLQTETLQALEQRTDGWVTALQMAAVSMRNQSDPTIFLANVQGDAHYLVDFLAEEVLDRQSEDIREFLLKTSILDTFNGSLCEAVVNPEAQPGYGSVMITRLEHAHLFITALDEKHEWFRYHPLFADFLRHIHSEINPEEIPGLQKRAALWYEENSNLDEAFQYALASGDMEWTADTIERNVLSMIKTGEIFAITRCIEKLPDEIIHQRPSLCLAYAWGLIAAYRLDLARYWLEDVQQSLGQYEDHINHALSSDDSETSLKMDDSGLWNLRGGLAICQSTLALLSGDVEGAAEFSRQATSYLREENPFINSLLALDDSLYFVLSGDCPNAVESLRNTLRIARQANNLLVMIISTCQLADMLMLKGQLSQAWAVLQKAQYMATGPDGKPLPVIGLVDIEFGEILLERNSLDEARTYLERGTRLSQSLWSMSNLDGMVSLARLYQAQGDINGAKATIEEALSLAYSTESSQWDDTFIATVAVRLALERGDLTEAEHWWKKAGLPYLSGAIVLENYPYHIYEYLLLTQARFLLVRGQDIGSMDDLQRASKLLGSLLYEAERFQRVTSQIEILILQALVSYALGDEQAKNTLLQALALGEPEGYRQIYLDEGQRISGLLQQCQSARQVTGNDLPSLGFIEQLLEELPPVDGEQSIVPQVIVQQAVPTVVETDDRLPASLSAREMEVLKLIAEGKSNQEISAELYLALNTVKRHAYNIYAKLDVRKRTQAVSKARHLGLLP